MEFQLSSYPSEYSARNCTLDLRWFYFVRRASLSEILRISKEGLDFIPFDICSAEGIVEHLFTHLAWLVQVLGESISSCMYNGYAFFYFGAYWLVVSNERKVN